MSLGMWSDQNNHGKIRINALSNTKWSINIISMSKSRMNISMKHKENSYLGILYQYESIIIISMSNISNKYINEAQRKITVSESPIKIIDQSNQSCQCPKWKLGNPQCAIKKWVSTNRLIKSHLCFILSSSLTL